MTEQATQYGDPEAVARLLGESANDDGPDPSDAYDELNRREQQGGGSWPFDPVIAENIKVWYGVGFGVVAKKRGDHWQITPDDGHRLGVATAQVIHRFIPDFDNVGPVGNLAIVAAGLIGPRIMLDAVQGRPKRQDKQQSTNDEGGEGEPD
ncbi:hypothetical protein [Saccharospirillum salsuginis]|uniref:Uncharacterized protein n=1 Tax=Saccharospirillum salsuginis TaxID=418750 RepID=A0A918K6F4_9GAMM|nr:hypothetical protein [Saccharospirillum salsuginis]GGX52278.1 hypothetical protein GCM10007392_19510 [Saccharospirillum salsuginis]